MAQPLDNPLVLTLDVGSTGVRARLFDRHGTRQKLKAKRPHTLTTPRDGGAVLDPVVVATACEVVIDEIVAGQASDTIIAVASDTLVPNIVGLDAAGTPVTPVYTWGDTRAHAAAVQLRTRLDPEDYHQRTGCFLHASYVPAKLLWLRQTAPELYHQVRRWVSLGEYLALRWFGEARCSLSVASWSGLLDRQTLQWDGPTLEALGLDVTMLGTLTDVGDTLHGLLPAYHRRWPALSAVPFLPTVGDGVGSNIGSDCMSGDRVALAIGTSGAMRVLLEGAPERLPAGLWCYRVDHRRVLLGGAVSNGTNVPEWLTQTLKLPPPNVLEPALAVLPPDGHGLTVLPLLAGERSPGWADDATATFTGLRLSTQPVGMFQAALEAVAYRFALILRALAPYLPSEHSIVASGRGALASPVWTQIMADVFGRPVIASVQKSATARGIALLALDELGLEPLGRGSLAAATIFQPRPERHAIYVGALERHVQLYETVIGGQGSGFVTAERGV